MGACSRPITVLSARSADPPTSPGTKGGTRMARLSLTASAGGVTVGVDTHGEVTLQRLSRAIWVGHLVISR